MELGTIGVWRAKRHGAGDLGELEAHGYRTFWIGSSPSVEEARPYLEATTTMTVATGILNVWQHRPEDVADAYRQVASDRFLLGIGIGHPEATSDYKRPLKTMREFFDGMDLPKDRLVAAALGPKMLDLAKERSLGAHPYFTTPEHTQFARERLGAGPLLAPELAVVVEADPETARKQAREYAKLYLGLSNYTSNLLKFGFTERDIVDGGSDRLIDAVIPHGSAQAIAEAVRAHLEAGADHVCLQPLGHGPNPARDYEELAKALL